jgi:hypothetical protein
MASDAGAGSNEAPRKTLDDIRRELEAEYPLTTTDHRVGEPDEAPARVSLPPYPDEEQEAVERSRSARHRSRRTRGRAIAAAIGAIAGQVLLVVFYFALTWDSIWPGAPARAPEIVEPRAEPSAAVLPPPPAPTPAPAVDRHLEAFRAELEALADKLQRSESRIAGMESRVRGVESSVRKLGDDVASAAVARRAERARPVPRQTADTAAPAAAVPPAPAPVTTESERWIPSDRPVPRNTSRPRNVRPLAEPVAPSTHSMLLEPRTDATPSLATRPQSPEPVAPATDVAPSQAASVPSVSASASAVPPTLRDRVRDEWRMFKQGLALVGEDLKTTVSDLARKVRGE